MDWWNDLTDWTASDEGWRVLSGAIIPFVAIVVAGVIAALIGRAATKRVVALHDRESRNAAVAGVVTAARKASRWGALGHEERAYADHLAEDADVRLRLLPVSGAPLAADWVQHEIADIKRNSSTFTSQADQSLGELRDRLLEWNGKPGRAKKLFKADLERWKFDSRTPTPTSSPASRTGTPVSSSSGRPRQTPARPRRARRRPPPRSVLRRSSLPSVPLRRDVGGPHLGSDRCAGGRPGRHHPDRRRPRCCRQPDAPLRRPRDGPARRHAGPPSARVADRVGASGERHDSERSERPRLAQRRLLGLRRGRRDRSWR